MPLSKAMADAARAAGAEIDDADVEQETPEPEVEDPETAETDDDSETSGEDESDEDESQQPDPETDEDTDDEWPEDVPESYMGIKLKGVVAPVAAKEHFTALKEQERVVNSRLAEIAEARKNTKPETVIPETPQAPEPLSVEAQLTALGMDPDVIEQVGLMPLASKLLELDSSFNSSQEQAQASEWERNFHKELDSLEKDNGELPYERDDIVAYAMAEDIYNPRALYWDIAGPLREAANTALAKKVKAAETKVATVKKAVKGTRRQSSKGTTGPVKFKNIADAMAAAKKAAAE